MTAPSSAKERLPEADATRLRSRRLSFLPWAVALLCLIYAIALSYQSSAEAVRRAEVTGLAEEFYACDFLGLMQKNCQLQLRQAQTPDHRSQTLDGSRASIDYVLFLQSAEEDELLRSFRDAAQGLIQDHGLDCGGMNYPYDPKWPVKTNNVLYASRYRAGVLVGQIIRRDDHTAVFLVSLHESPAE